MSLSIGKQADNHALTVTGTGVPYQQVCMSILESMLKQFYKTIDAMSVVCYDTTNDGSIFLCWSSCQWITQNDMAEQTTEIIQD